MRVSITFNFFFTSTTPNHKTVNLLLSGPQKHAAGVYSGFPARFVTNRILNWHLTADSAEITIVKLSIVIQYWRMEAIETKYSTNTEL